MFFFPSSRLTFMWNRTIVFLGTMNRWLCREIWYGCLKCHHQQCFFLFFSFLLGWTLRLKCHCLFSFSLMFLLNFTHLTCFVHKIWIVALVRPTCVMASNFTLRPAESYCECFREVKINWQYSGSGKVHIIAENKYGLLSKDTASFISKHNNISLSHALTHKKFSILQSSIL